MALLWSCETLLAAALLPQEIAGTRNHVSPDVGVLSFSEWRSTFSESHFKPVAIHELPKASHSLRNEEYILRVWGAGVEGQALRRGFLRSWVWEKLGIGTGADGG